MTENPQPPLSDTEKLLAALEAERQRRIQSGTLSARPIMWAIVDDDETDEQAMARSLAEHLKEHPTDPTSVHAYEWVLRVTVDPLPTVETHPYAPDHAATVDVTPAPYRPPPPSPPPSSARSLPPPRGMLDPRNVNIPRDVGAAERRRTQRFESDDWGSPADHPIRYPRGNRNGW